MKDLFTILETYDALQHSPERLALATIVKTKGAAGGLPGARMLMIEGDGTVGSLGGGNLESKVLDRAKLDIMHGTPQYWVYDNSDSNEVKTGGKPGAIIHLLVEPVSHPQGALQFRFFHECLRGHKSGVMATLFRIEGELKVSAGARVTLLENGVVTEDVKDPTLTAVLLEDCRDVLDSGHSKNGVYALTHGLVEAWIEFIAPS